MTRIRTYVLALLVLLLLMASLIAYEKASQSNRVSGIPIVWDLRTDCGGDLFIQVMSYATLALALIAFALVGASTVSDIRNRGRK
jgi:hypothetical protein